MLGFRIIVISLFLIIIVSSINYQTDALESEVIEGKLTASCGTMPFGGEDVGSFEMKKGKRGSKDWIESLKIWMKEPPSKGEYVVGFMDIGSRPSKLPEALVKVEGYRDDGKVMIVQDKPMPSLNNVLFVAERDPKDLGLQWSFINIVGTAYLVPPTESFPEANKFEYNNATIIHTLDIAKNEYNVGEKLELKPKLINIGNKTVRIIHGHPIFIINAYDSNGKAAWVDSGIILTIGIFAELEPGVPYGGSEYNLQKEYDITFCKPGEYKLVSYAYFSIEEEGASLPHDLKIYSEHVTIKVNHVNTDMEKLEKAHQIVTQKIGEKDPDLPVIFAAIDPSVPELVIGIDEKAPLTLSVYKERLKQLLGDIPMRVELGHIDIDPSWSLDASLTNGKINQMEVDKDSTSLIIDVSTIDNDGEMIITLPRELIDAKKNGEDEQFIVLVDGKKVEFEEIETSGTSRALRVDVPLGTKKIEIIGTQVVPEFPIGLLILATGITSIIFLNKVKR